MYSVLFIDDEVNLLSGLKRGLRPLREEFSFEFASDPTQAVELTRGRVFDLVVSDMRMPRMEGAEVLSLVRQLSPETQRVILSGQSSLDSFFRALPCTHRYLSKPCNLDDVKRLALQVKDLREILPARSARQVLTNLSALPGSLERLDRFIELAQAGLLGHEEATHIAQSECGLLAQLLHLYTTTSQGHGRLPESVSRLLVDLPHMFTERMAEVRGLISAPRMPKSAPQPSSWWIELSQVARQIACRLAPDLEREVYWAALLLPIGESILEEHFSSFRQTEGTYVVPTEDGAPLSVEGNRIIAYVSSLWGLPAGIVETLRWYRAPDEFEPGRVQGAGILHAACHSVNVPDSVTPPRCASYLTATGLSPLIEHFSSRPEGRKGVL